MVLTLKASGIDDLRRFRWLESPSETALNHAQELLLDLGALRDETGHTVITQLGRRMLAFPVHPRYARMLLAAQEYDCVYEACLVAALTQGRDLLLRNPGKDVVAAREDLFGGSGKTFSDFWILMRAWDYAVKNRFQMDLLRQAGIHGAAAREVGSLHEQFLRIAGEEGLKVKPDDVADESKDEALRKCILIGFSDRAGRLDPDTLRCELVHGRRGMLTPDSVVRHSPLIVAAEIREVSGRPGEVNTILSLATAIEIAWLQELFRDDMRSGVEVRFDSVASRLEAAEVLRFRDLTVAAERVEPPPADASARLLAEEVVAGRLQLRKWDHSITQWILRLNLLADWCPDLELPPVRDEERRHIIEQLCFGAVSYKDLKEREVKPVVQSWLSQSQRRLLDVHAPERVTLSNGRTPKITYVPNGPPYVSMRIQELFGVTETPRIGMGRIPLTVHILAPSMRPVQVTQDLANF